MAAPSSKKKFGLAGASASSKDTRTSLERNPASSASRTDSPGRTSNSSNQTVTPRSLSARAKERAQSASRGGYEMKTCRFSIQFIVRAGGPDMDDGTHLLLSRRETVLRRTLQSAVVAYEHEPVLVRTVHRCNDCTLKRACGQHSLTPTGRCQVTKYRAPECTRLVASLTRDGGPRYCCDAVAVPVACD